MAGCLHEDLHDFHCDPPPFMGNKIFATKPAETNKIITYCQSHLLPKSYDSRDKTNAKERTTVVPHSLVICSKVVAGLSGCIVTLYPKLQYTYSHNLRNHTIRTEMAS